MSHIARHFERSEPETGLRPDFGVIHHMWKFGLLSDEDLEAAKGYSERPGGCSDIVSRKHHTSDIQEEDLDLRVIYNQRDEDRYMRRKHTK